MAHGLHNLAAALLVALAVAAAPARADSFDLPYTGRLTQADGAPYKGTVDLEVRFFGTATGQDHLLPDPILFNDVRLDDGVFQISVNLSPTEIASVFGSGTTDVFLQIKDTTHSVTHARQRLMSVPYALRVPIDPTKLFYDTQGRLSVDYTNVSVGPGGFIELGQHNSSPGCLGGDAGKVWYQGGYVVYCDGSAVQTLTPTSAGGITAGSPDVLTNKTFDADAAGNALSNVDNTNIKPNAAIDATKIGGGQVSNTELGHLDGVTAGIQGQLDAQTTALSGKATSAHVHSSLDGAGGGAANAVYVLNSGNVGIGTTVPTAKLEIAGVSGTDGIKFPDGTTLKGVRAPTISRLTSGSGATYTVPAGVTRIVVKMVGGGGGGLGVNAASHGSGGGNGGTTSFAAWTAGGGYGSPAGIQQGQGGQGGSNGTGSLLFRTRGSPGETCTGGTALSSANGGRGPWGGEGRGIYQGASEAGQANSGAGGGSSCGTTYGYSGTGGGSGEYVEFMITSPAATYTYTVGAGGSAGGGTYAGGAGGSGLIIVEEHYY